MGAVFSTLSIRTALSDVFTKFLDMPYYSNAHVKSGSLHTHAKHEDALKEVMTNAGYSVWKPKVSLKKADERLASFAKDMPRGSFIEQPFSSQQTPDFFVKTWTGKVVPVEAKSSKTSYSPTYNSGGVKAGYFYVFCCQLTDETTIFKGSSIISESQQKLLDEYIKEEKTRVKVLNEKLKECDSSVRGISYYARPMICQSGGAKFTNYFAHESRKEVEASAISALKDIESGKNQKRYVVVDDCDCEES